MQEFFKGWRRKLSLLTLIVALLFMGGWVRSLSHEDEIVVILFHRVHSLAFEPGWISWWSWSDPSEITWPRKSIEWNTRLIGSPPETFEEYMAELESHPTIPKTSMPGEPTIISLSFPTYPWSKRRAVARAAELRKNREIRRRSRELDERINASEDPFLDGNDALGLAEIDDSPAVIGYPEIRTAKLSCPYWVVINSLASICAYLLLVKPRQTAPKQATEPAPTTRT